MKCLCVRELQLKINFLGNKFYQENISVEQTERQSS